MYPYLKNEGSLKNRFVVPTSNKNCHFHYACSYIFMGTSSGSLFYPEMSHYLSGTGGLNYDQNKI